MKKYLLIAALSLVGVAVARAGSNFEVPSANTNQPAPIQYGGVFVSTFSGSGGAAGASINYGTATIRNAGVFYGVMFSSAPIYPDPMFVDVFDSTSVDTRGGRQIARVYNNSFTQFGSTVSSGFSGPPVPLRFGAGLIYRPSVASQPIFSVLYYAE